MTSAIFTVDDLIEEWSPKIRQAFLDALALIRDRVVLVDVVERLIRGDIDGALTAVGIDPIAFRALDATIAQAFEAGGAALMGGFPAIRAPDGHRLKVLFDVRNYRAETWLRNHSSELVREIVEDQRQAVRQHLVAGMEAGDNPRRTALELVGRINPTSKKREGGTIGLTSSQERWVRNYADELARGDANALSRKLRDKRFDRSVAKAIEKDEPLSAEQRAKMVAAYKTRALRYRAETLARTEAMTALNQSQVEAVQQSIDKGIVQSSNVTKTWKSAVDSRVRNTHSILHNQRVRFHESFVSASGARLRYPGDPDAPPAERVQCRCTLSLRVDFIALAARRAA